MVEEEHSFQYPVARHGFQASRSLEFEEVRRAKPRSHDSWELQEVGRDWKRKLRNGLQGFVLSKHFSLLQSGQCRISCATLPLEELPCRYRRCSRGNRLTRVNPTEEAWLRRHQVGGHEEAQQKIKRELVLGDPHPEAATSSPYRRPHRLSRNLLSYPFDHGVL